MAITKEITVDKVEVVGKYNALQVKYLTTIKEDDKNYFSKCFKRSI